MVSVPCGKSNVLGIVARLRAGRFGVQFPAEAKDLLRIAFRTVLGPTQSAIQWLPEILLPVKQPGREFDNSFPYSVRIENGKGIVSPRTGHEGPGWEFL